MDVAALPCVCVWVAHSLASHLTTRQASPPPPPPPHTHTHHTHTHKHTLQSTAPLSGRCGGRCVLVLEESSHHVLVLEEEDPAPPVREVVDGNEPVAKELDEGRDVLHDQEADDGREVDLAHQWGHNVAEDVQVRVGDLAQREPGVLVPVDVREPGQQHAHEQNERVKSQEVGQRLAQQNEGVHGRGGRRVVDAELTGERADGGHHAEVARLLPRRLLGEAEFPGRERAQGPRSRKVRPQKRAQGRQPRVDHRPARPLLPLLLAILVPPRRARPRIRARRGGRAGRPHRPAPQCGCERNSLPLHPRPLSGGAGGSGDAPPL
mmetsp:Transcript_15691/g.39946  ORF Transcript_15691/g.39946 Transcript_15691/m.39946 type:complete len:321 (+) Transcript_15691:233-1195(+)